MRHQIWVDNGPESGGDNNNNNNNTASLHCSELESSGKSECLSVDC